MYHHHQRRSKWAGRALSSLVAPRTFATTESNAAVDVAIATTRNAIFGGEKKGRAKNVTQTMKVLGNRRRERRKRGSGMKDRVEGEEEWRTPDSMNETDRTPKEFL